MLSIPECFPYADFRPHQREVIEAVLDGRNVLAVLPTGSGKSLCYQLPGVLSEGLTLVVSPLLALIQDQAGALQRMGIPDVYSFSALQNPESNTAALEAIEAGRARFVFAAPERLNAPALRQALGQRPPALVAVDEAHCICEWGHDFRPDYLRLKSFLAEVRPRSVLALTATATPRVQRGILYALGLPRADIVVGKLDRPNLKLEVRTCTATRRLRTLGDVLRDLPAVIYVARKRDAFTTAAWLSERGIPALCYHAGLEPEVRKRAQDAFLTNQVPVLVATNAFGMGVDKADIRTVVHFQAPGALEAYFQEAGRAGRDGQAARAIILHDPLDTQSLEYFHERRFPTLDEIVEVHAALERRVPAAARHEFSAWDTSRWNLALGALLGADINPNERREPDTVVAAWVKLLALRKAARERLDAMLAYLDQPDCRRRVLLEYFGQTLSGCGGCDCCRESQVVRVRRKPAPHLESAESLSSLASAGEHETQARSSKGGNALA